MTSLSWMARARRERCSGSPPPRREERPIWKLVTTAACAALPPHRPYLSRGERCPWSATTKHRDGAIAKIVGVICSVCAEPGNFGARWLRDSEHRVEL